MSEKRRILIVEDEETMQEIYKSIFEEEKDAYDIEITGDARVAFKKLEKEAFDLVVLDIIMEPMNGETFFACLRSNGNAANMPVLVTSVLPSESLKQSMKSQRIDFLQKPITKKDLFDKIEKLLS